VKHFTTGQKMSTIPQPSVKRLCTIYQFLSELEHEGIASISSAELGEKVGIGSHNVRKDISFIGGIGNCGSGYDIAKLKEKIATNLGLNDKKLTCIVGLGRIGSALLQHARHFPGEYKIVAGFDSNINKVETIKTDVSVFPAYQITEMVKRMEINLGIIAVPESAAQEAATRLIEGGIKGIVNFSATHIKNSNKDIFIRNVDITSELRILSALIKINVDNQQQ
jgi:redox-sensing transcriptional repressor